MAKEALATKYRPKAFDDVVEQESIKIILKQQLETNSFQHAYLFVGPAGCGKTTNARIFANEINKGVGNPIELDAASNSGVDDVRDIITQSKLAPIDGSEYKVFIIDECHSLSSSAWQAFLKLIEEPPAKSIFIFCTTDPQKIPKTILSRVQRFDYKRISQQGIVERLEHILFEENNNVPFREGGIYKHDTEALEYLAKLSDGGMRTAISLMDKCLSYSSELTVENVVKALGVADYETMMELTDWIISKDGTMIIRIIEQIHADGLDLKQFIRQYLNFILDLKKICITDNFDYTNLPQTDTMIKYIDSIPNDAWEDVFDLLETLIKLNTEIKYDSSPKYMIEAMLLGGINK